MFVRVYFVGKSGGSISPETNVDEYLVIFYMEVNKHVSSHIYILFIIKIPLSFIS